MAVSTEKKKKIREPKEVVVVKNTYDYQRMKLNRLMKNPVRFGIFIWLLDFGFRSTFLKGQASSITRQTKREEIQSRYSWFCQKCNGF